MTTAWVREIRGLLIQSRGGGCEECGSPFGIEFHHLAQTGLDGLGRGSFSRVRDVLLFPERYILLCRPHHVAKHSERFP